MVKSAGNWLVSSTLVHYAMAFEASLMLITLQGSLVVTVKSLETCRLETETLRTVSKSLETVGDKHSFR